MITRLKLLKDLGVKSLIAKSDLQLVISWVNGTYETKVPCLAKYLEKLKGLLESFEHFKLERILGSKNDHVNSFTKLVSIRCFNENHSII